MTQALTAIVKQGYAPVEQYSDQPGIKQGAWTDIYALAAVIHRIIVGKTPPPSVERLMQDTYQPLATAAAGRFSAHFLRGLDRCLAVKALDRPQTIAQMRAALGWEKEEVSLLLPPRVSEATASSETSPKSSFSSKPAKTTAPATKGAATTRQQNTAQADTAAGQESAEPAPTVTHSIAGLIKAISQIPKANLLVAGVAGLVLVAVTALWGSYWLSEPLPPPKTKPAQVEPAPQVEPKAQNPTRGEGV
jgi:hypothetical protein